jgi:hypothetical protein
LSSGGRRRRTWEEVKDLLELNWTENRARSCLYFCLINNCDVRVVIEVIKRILFKIGLATDLSWTAIRL